MFNHRHSTPDGSRLMPLVLFFVALVPAACVLWFMTIAMRNDRLAVQQELTAVYVNHLGIVQRELTAFMKEKLAGAKSASGGAPAAIFASIVRSNIADSAVIYDHSGQLLYPLGISAGSGRQNEEQGEWTAARDLEFLKTNYIAAAEAYGRIGASTADPHAKARAFQSQASCLAKAGNRAAAVEVLARLSSHPGLRHTIGSQGTLTVPNAELMLLKLIEDPADARFERTLQSLIYRLNDYDDPQLGASQRRFLMEEVSSLAGVRLLAAAARASGQAGNVELLDEGRPHRNADALASSTGEESGSAARHARSGAFPTLEAERLAAEYVETKPSFPARALLEPAAMPRVWRLSDPALSSVLLFREERLLAEGNALLSRHALAETALRLFSPREKLFGPNLVPPQDAGEMMPGWRVALTFKAIDPFEAASKRQAAIYRWTGSLVIVITGLLALLVARFVNAQIRLTRLKDDLVSTVSHELKTPLASMRALVDTLIAGRYRDGAQLENYLGLISKENQRLSHLIENFLSFSRMERRKRRFQMEAVSVPDLVDKAVAPLRERFNAPGCRFEIDLSPELPVILGDREALATVLINLLDNAWKYTNENKHIQLRAARRNGSVLLEVQDNGIGISKRDVPRIFDRFYQADQSLTRKVGGCGLGLSIVEFIVRGHGGTVNVSSERGEGSTFTVRLPIGKERRGVIEE